MDLLMNNPLADMYGPYFLVLYAASIALVVVACRALVRRLDWTADMAPPPVPAEPDPHEIAYLRGGENEVTRSVVFALVQKDLLRVARTGRGYQVGRTTRNPDRTRLTPIELRALDWFTHSRKPSEFFKTSELASQLKPFCAAYEQRLRGGRLLTTDDVRRTARLVALAGAALVVGLGAYKLVVAVAEGRFNVGFLVILCAVGLFVIFKVCRAPRVSSRGRAYLERLRLAFERLKYQAQTARTPSTPSGVEGEAAAVHGVDPALLLLVGVFGVGALAGTPFAPFEQSFQRSAQQSGDASGGGSGCGSSCGSASDSSSGGGSGCGSSCGGSCGGGCGGGCGG